MNFLGGSWKFEGILREYFEAPGTFKEKLKGIFDSVDSVLELIRQSVWKVKVIWGRVKGLRVF